MSALSGVGLDALRKIEQGRVAAPSFFIVADLAAAVGADLVQLDQQLREGVAQ